jgi:hypothetical protein
MDSEGVLARGTFTVAASKSGQQEIHVALLTGLRYSPDEQVLVQWAQAIRVEPPSDAAWLREYRANERVRGYVLMSVGRSHARHVLIAGPSASPVFSGATTDLIVLPSGGYSYHFGDVPAHLQAEALEGFSELRRREPDQGHILVCPTSATTASDCGVFDALSPVDDGAAVYVVGLGSRPTSLVAAFFRCVNSTGKAKGSIHWVVSMDNASITNEEFGSVHALVDPLEKLRYFWDMAELRTGPEVQLLAINAA